jgi:hypothetical protein
VDVEVIWKINVSVQYDDLRVFSQSELQKAGRGVRIVAGPWDLRFLEDVNNYVS